MIYSSSTFKLSPNTAGNYPLLRKLRPGESAYTAASLIHQGGDADPTRLSISAQDIRVSIHVLSNSLTSGL